MLHLGPSALKRGNGNTEAYINIPSLLFQVHLSHLFSNLRFLSVSLH